MTKQDTPRVYGIGLPRAGGQTLQTALAILYPDHDVVHSPGKQLPRIIENDKVIACVEVYAPVQWILSRDPDALFVLNTRKEIPWIKSCASVYHKSRHWNHPMWKYPFEQLIEYREEYMDIRHRWATALCVGRKNTQILVHDFTREPSWDRLCEFLKVPVPDQPFPRTDRVKHA